MTQTEDLAQFDPASFEHIPVLLNECLDGLNIDPAGMYLDGTAGGAGHSRQIALRLDGAKGGRLVSLDQDPDAVQTARARLAGLPATVVQINFRYAGQALESLGIEKINGALLDLGVSSHQLDDAARGFSYRADAPLDMRMSLHGRLKRAETAFAALFHPQCDLALGLRRFSATHLRRHIISWLTHS